MKHPEGEQPLTLDVERFSRDHPAINGDLYVEHAREALGYHGAAPMALQLHRGRRLMDAVVTFKPADERTVRTEQRPVTVERGAIVMAGLVLNATEQLQITRVTSRGSRVDYFVGTPAAEMSGILEVSGTDDGSLEHLRRKKATQLEESYYHRPPFNLKGFVSVTRFAVPTASALDDVPAEVSHAD